MPLTTVRLSAADDSIQTFYVSRDVETRDIRKDQLAERRATIPPNVWLGTATPWAVFALFTPHAFSDFRPSVT